MIQDVQGQEQLGFKPKVVKMECRGNFLSGGNNSNATFFNKNAFRYDKYELCKVINFDNFDMLFRPFKQNKNYQRYIKLERYSKFARLAFILFSMMYSLLYRIGIELPISWSYFLLFQTIVAVVFSICCFNMYDKTLKDLQNFSVNLAENGIDIFMINKKVKQSAIYSIIKHIFMYRMHANEDYITQFQIESLLVQEEQDYVKLYCKYPENFLCNADGTAPVIQEGQFQFCKQRLQKLIPFTDLQNLLQPFALNEFYSKMNNLFSPKMTHFLLFFAGFLYIFIDDLGLFETFLGFLIATVLIIWQSTKSAKTRSKIVSELRLYCQKVSDDHEKIEIIVELYQKNQSNEDKIIYCLLVRKKEMVENATHQITGA